MNRLFITKALNRMRSLPNSAALIMSLMPACALATNSLTCMTDAKSKTTSLAVSSGASMYYTPITIPLTIPFGQYALIEASFVVTNPNLAPVSVYSYLGVGGLSGDGSSTLPTPISFSEPSGQDFSVRNLHHMRQTVIGWAVGTGTLQDYSLVVYATAGVVNLLPIKYELTYGHLCVFYEGS